MQLAIVFILFVPCHADEPLKWSLGESGIIRASFFQVLEVLGPEEMLVRGVHVAATKGGEEALLIVTPQFVLKGVSTKGVVDESKIKQPAVKYKVIDTRKVNNKTIFVASPIKD